MLLSSEPYKIAPLLDRFVKAGSTALRRLIRLARIDNVPFIREPVGAVLGSPVTEIQVKERIRTVEEFVALIPKELFVQRSGGGRRARGQNGGAAGRFPRRIGLCKCVL